MSLGSRSGIEISFETNAIDRITIARAGREIRVREALNGTPGATFLPLASPVRNFRLAAAGSGGGLRENITCHQSLAVGERRIEIRNILSDPDAGVSRFSAERSSIKGHVILRFDLPGARAWTIEIAGVHAWKQHDRSTAELSLAESIGMTIKASGGSVHRDEADGRGGKWTVDLAPGETVVDISIRVDAWNQIADSMVLCRPNQMREAAVVLSAIPDRRFVPLVVLDPPPMERNAFNELLKKFKAETDDVLEQLGPLALAEFSMAAREQQLRFARQHLSRRTFQQQLAPYRSWSKRNLMLHQALTDFKIAKAICLFEPAADDFAMSSDEAATADGGNVAGRRPSGFMPEGVESIVLVPPANCADGPAEGRRQALKQLVYACRECYGRPLSGSDDWAEAEDDSAAGTIAGLYEARRCGLPLRFTPAERSEHKTGIRIVGAQRSGNHVIVAEAQDNAQSLAAALYAAHLNTQLMVTPPVDLLEVERCVVGMQQAVVDLARKGSPPQPSNAAEDAEALSHDPVGQRDAKRFSLADLKKAARRIVLGDRRFERIEQLEKAVTAQVPVDLIDALADSALTVFTAGLPYSFVKSARADWSDKQIGHIVSDADLVVINELHNLGSIDPLISFNLIVDSGHFRNSETDDVAEKLRARPSHSIILREDESLGMWVLALLGALPAEFVLFITHGVDDAILLGNWPLQNYQIPQWFQLLDRPLIFNNSCQSWTGVGREFVRVGARGYIGTLWSVGASDAADLARVAMERMIVEGAWISAAIRNTAVDPMTARAYIYVGSALATYPGAGTRERSDALGMLIGVLNAYLHVLSNIRQVSIGASGNFPEQLYQEFKLLRSRVKELGGADVAPVLVDLGLRELDMLSENADQIRVGHDAQLALCSNIEPFLRQAAFSDIELNERRAELLFNRARLKWMKGDFEAAERDAQESSNLYDKFGRSGAQPRQLQIDIARDAGNLGRALDLAVAAREYFSKRNERVSVLNTLGRLCQLLKRNPARLDEAIAYGTEGIELAKSLDDLGEERTFALDLAQLYLLKNRPQESVDMAKRALRLARRASSAVGELAVYGTLGQAYTKLQDLKSARWHIEQGLDRARILNEPTREATFLNDLAAVEELEGHTAKANDLRFQAIDVAAELPSSQSWTATIGLLLSKAVATGDVGQCLDILTRGLGSFVHMTPHVAADATALLFMALSQFYVGFKPPRRSQLFAGLDAQTSAIESRIGQNPAIGGQAAAVMGWGKILLLLSQGYRNEARQLVGELDVITGGKLNLTMIVERLSLL